MLDKIRLVGKQTIVYGFGTIINKLLGFILIPLYISYIPISDFGNLTIFEISIQFLSALLTFGLHNAHQRYFFIEKDNKTYGLYLFNNFFGNLFLSIIVLIPFLLFPAFFSNLIFSEASQATSIQIALWIIPTEVLFNFAIQIFQYENKPFRFLFSSTGKLLVSLVFTLYFVIQVKMGIEGVLLARLIGGTLTIVILIVTIVIPRCTFKLDLSFLNKSIKFGFPMIISSIGSMIFLLSDRYMLKWLSTDAEVGKYGFGLKIANFIYLIFIQTIGLSYFPSVMNTEGSSNSNRFYGKMLTYYCFLTGLIILAFLFSYREILSLVVKDKGYWEGLNVVPLLCLSFMIMGMNYFVGVGLFLSKKTNNYLIPSFLAAAANIGINIKLIPLYGMIGAGISVVLAQVIYTWTLTYLSGKYVKIDFEWKKVFLIYFLGMLTFAISEWFTFENIFLSLTIRFSMLFLLPLILYKFGFFEQVEIIRLKQGLQKVIKKIKV